jgi:hypothetical protein
MLSTWNLLKWNLCYVRERQDTGREMQMEENLHEN